MTGSIAPTPPSEPATDPARTRASNVANGFLALFAHRVDAELAEGAHTELAVTTPDTAMGLVGEAHT
ncbi:MAG: hypothetical protein KDA28_10455, partial [Phycisphaerales bacterium]|nr:hypothetical protein [Phycisphaerales bacterium]